jgi:flagellar assembly protein FliH
MTPWRTPPLAANRDDPLLEEAYSEELASLRARAEEEGRAAGIEQAKAEFNSRLQAGLDQLDVLLAAMRRPCEDLDDEVIDELGRLAGHIAKQILRRELKTSPEAILGVVREAVASLPEDRAGAKVYLNHEDVKLIEELTHASNQERGWELLSDPAVSRGDCIVHRGASMVDASLDERAQAAMLQVLGGDRAEDGSV